MGDQQAMQVWRQGMNQIIILLVLICSWRKRNSNKRRQRNKKQFKTIRHCKVQSTTVKLQ